MNIICVCVCVSVCTHLSIYFLDLLDNLFDPTNSTGSRHRTTSNSNNNNNNGNNSNNNNSNSNPSPEGSNPSLADTEVCVPSVENIKQGNEENTKDPYLVDVDVDVDGVMMDGLDQVEYMNRGVGSTANGRFYNENSEDGLLIDEDGDLYNEQGSRYISEPISRTLEALALEGLTEF